VLFEDLAKVPVAGGSSLKYGTRRVSGILGGILCAIGGPSNDRSDTRRLYLGMIIAGSGAGGVYGHRSVGKTR